VISTKRLAVLSLIGLVTAISAGASLGAQPTVLGNIVEVNPGAQTIVLRVGVAEGEPVLRRFRLGESARIHVDGGVARLADLLVGQTARIGYVRANGANIAEIVETTTTPPAGSPISDTARAATGIEERRRYLDEVERTLDVLEESVEELSQFPEIEGTDQLTRRAALVEDLETRIAAARTLLASLSATAGQEIWTLGVDRLSAALADLTAAHERAWSIIGNR
jgi:hypothetical protein